MEIRRQLFSDLIRERTAGIPVRRHDKFMRANFGGRFGNLRNNVIIRGHGDLRREIAETDFGPRRSSKLAAGVFDDNLSTRKGSLWSNIFNCDTRH